MNIAIIIVTHNSDQVIGNCLSAMGTHLQQHVLAVDNASTDRTLATLHQYGIRTLQLKENVGFGRAANTGAAAVTEGLLCFLNPDCEMTPDVVVAATQAFENCRIVCAAPTLVEAHGITEGVQPGYTRMKLCADMLRTNGENLLWRLLARFDGYHERSWSWPHGACFFIRRDLFMKMGGFDTRFFMYMEDVDLGLRISQAGLVITRLVCRVPHRMWHGSAVPLDKRIALLNRGRLAYATQYYGRTFAQCLSFVASASRLAAKFRWALR